MDYFVDADSCIDNASVQAVTIQIKLPPLSSTFLWYCLWFVTTRQLSMHSNFWVCRWNPKVWPFRWKLVNSTFSGTLLFIMLFKVVLSFESVDEFLKYDASNESYWAGNTVLYCCFLVSYNCMHSNIWSVDKTPRCDDSNESYWVAFQWYSLVFSIFVKWSFIRNSISFPATALPLSNETGNGTPFRWTRVTRSLGTRLLVFFLKFWILQWIEAGAVVWEGTNVTMLPHANQFTLVFNLLKPQKPINSDWVRVWIWML